MRRLFTWLGIAVLALVALVVVTLTIAIGISTSRQNKRWNVTPEAIAFPTDSASLEHGRHLATAVSVCSDCHGTDFGGKQMIDSPVMGTLWGSNLTRGRGGIGATYTDADWVRAIRHGLRPDGSALVFMPAESFQGMSDEDVGVIVSYIRTLPPVDREIPRARPGPLARVLHVAGALPLVPAELVDHERNLDAPPHGVTREYGEYLATMGGCTSCHGPALAGTGGGPGPNLTPGGRLAGWERDDFIRAIREGKRPDGTTLTDEMPWKSFSAMSDDELEALWLYVHSVPAVAMKK